MWYSLRRYVIIEISDTRPEWFLNALRNRGIVIQNVSFPSRTSLRLRMAARDFQKLHALSKERPFRVHILRREGGLFHLQALRHRGMLVFSSAIALFLFAYLAPRVLVISVSGCQQIPETALRRLLEEEGIRPLALKESIEVIPVADRIRARDDRIAWLGIDLDGVRCRVEVVEAIPFDPVVDSKTPCDVVAQKAGVIALVEAYNGLAAVAPGDRVEAGQTLIRGHITEPEAEDQVFVHARGRVEALVFYKSQAAVEGYETALADTGNRSPYRRITIGTVPLFTRGTDFSQFEIRETVSHPAVGTLLPLTLTEGIYYERAEARCPLEREEQISRAAAKAESLCYDKLPENAILQSVTTTYEEIDGVILAECVMVTKESIGLTKEISN